MFKKEYLFKVKEAERLLQGASEEKRNLFLENLAGITDQRRKKIIRENIKDLKNAKREGLSGVFVERLSLTDKSIDTIIESIQNTIKLSGGIGKIIERRTLKNGVTLKKIRVPIGVIFVIYESRPEVTVDVAALSIKSGNCVILKGGSEAKYTNNILFACIQEALTLSGLPDLSVIMLEDATRNFIYKLLERTDFIDLVIARGGYGLVKAVQARSRIPVLAHSAGGARIYVDSSADLEIAEKVIVDAKISKPAACNSVDTVLIDKKIDRKFIPNLVINLQRLGVEAVGDDEICRLIDIKKADESDWQSEFLDLKIALKFVGGIDEAIDFISKYSKGHSEGIIAGDKEVIKKFEKRVDCASLFINCSTRLHDGGIYGMGTEMGISTGKLHARGPVGLRELSTYKWIVEGNGQIRI